MANEINISAVPGLTVSLQLYQGLAAIGAPFPATEIVGTGSYVASMPLVPFGRYLVIAMSGAQKLDDGEIWWDGTHEITESMAMMRGLDHNNPWTVTKLQEYAGDIIIDVAGDNININTFTRQ